MAVESRRRFLVATGTAGAGAVGFAAVGRALVSGDVVAAVKAIPLPRPRHRRPVPDDVGFRVDGAAPYVTANTDFYRIDTALSAPRVDAQTWRLDIGGLVERPFSIDYRELLSLPSVEEAVTLQCVSNEVGGDLVGNAVWQGVRLRDLLERAGVRPDAEQVFSRSVDGWTCGFPLDVVRGDRVALVAYAMNGTRLPVLHGFPARLVVAGLYGYVSATKWLHSVELTTWDDVDGYWIPRGWSKEGPIKAASRIDVPRHGAELSPGPMWLAGVAWRPAIGIARVQVAIDDGPWSDCELGRVSSDDTWVQWRRRWSATSGSHRVRVRAVDRHGDPQSAAVAPPAPDGATGLHEVEFTVVG
ncbi:MAG: molybdopterin-dependent oxidoreductase [Microthrixaceae bacterium]